VLQFLKNLISNKIFISTSVIQKKEKLKYVISKKNPWLNPEDDFGKMERGKVTE
tara:strand:- start:256 stop:417 length:162 start_codon:yes stop_codon:yes gene_type:complete